MFEIVEIDLKLHVCFCRKMGGARRKRNVERNERTQQLVAEVKSGNKNIHLVLNVDIFLSLDVNKNLAWIPPTFVSRKAAMRQHKLTESVGFEI